MYASIRSEDLNKQLDRERDPPRREVESSNVKIDASNEQLWIKAFSRKESGKGINERIMNWTLDLKLNREDLRKIFAAAIEADLIAMPGLKSLQQAQRNLQRGLSELTRVANVTP